MKIKTYLFYTLVAALSITTLPSQAGGIGGLLSGAMSGGQTTDPISSIENNLLNSVTQNIAGSILNGQLGSQLSQGDQSFRAQQLTGALQSGNINQQQQWTNQETGSIMALNPVGQVSTHPQRKMPCQTIQETVTMPNGQVLNEERLACQNPQTGQWSLVK